MNGVNLIANFIINILGEEQIADQFLEDFNLIIQNSYERQKNLYFLQKLSSLFEDIHFTKATILKDSTVFFVFYNRFSFASFAGAKYCIEEVFASEISSPYIVLIEDGLEATDFSEDANKQAIKYCEHRQIIHFSYVGKQLLVTLFMPILDRFVEHKYSQCINQARQNFFNTLSQQWKQIPWTNHSSMSFEAVYAVIAKMQEIESNSFGAYLQCLKLISTIKCYIDVLNSKTRIPLFFKDTKLVQNQLRDILKVFPVELVSMVPKDSHNALRPL